MPPKAARTIRSENTDPALKDGVLSVPEFVASREFEIKAMELAQLNSKYAASTRVFQSLPRTLRRRAASHNVKRIPKRLRNRALREMNQSLAGASGTSSKSNARGRKLYRLKMSRKLLKLAAKLRLLRKLPTEGSGNIRQRIKNLSEQIEEVKKSTDATNAVPKEVEGTLNNDMGSFDNVGENKYANLPPGRRYAKRQLQFVWTPTHVWHAKRFHMIKLWGYQIPLRPTQKCFRSTSRASRSGAIAHETLYFGTIIAESADIQALFRALTGRKSLPGSYKSYFGWLHTPKKSTNGLIWCFRSSMMVRVHPSMFEEVFDFLQQHAENIYDCRYAFGSLEIAGPRGLSCLSKVLHTNHGAPSEQWLQLSRFNSDAVPQGTTFVLGMKDPRFWKHPRRPPVADQQTSFPDVMMNIANSKSTVDEKAASILMSSEGRNHSYKDQHTTKQLSSQFQRTSPLANSVAQFIIDNLPTIPVLITRTATTWCIVCPWYWVLPLWLKLVLVSEIQVGGAKQLHQINYERGIATFPADFPFHYYGWTENLARLTLTKSIHDKLPQSKKKLYMQYEGTVDPFGCDWFFLHKLVFGLKLYPNLDQGIEYGQFEGDTSRKIYSLNDLYLAIEDTRISQDTKIPVIELYDKNNQFHQQFAANTYTVSQKFPALPVYQIKIDLVNKGTLADYARIYKVPKALVHSYMTGSCTEGPLNTDIIGFVTSGTYNLKLGNPSGIGCIYAGYDENYVLVRNSGETLTRLATWKRLT